MEPIVEENPLSFIEVRKAINYGFDKDEMLLFLKNNRGIAATGGDHSSSVLEQIIQNI